MTEEQDRPARAAFAPRALAAALGGVVAVYGLGTAVLMATLGLRTPFADQWRQDMPLLQQPFPQNVLQLESGHRQVLPNLVRLADLHWLAGSGELLTWTGVVLFLAFLCLLARITWRDGVTTASDRPTRPLATPRLAAQRLAALAAVTLGVGWLANGRMLLHPNESVQVGGVLLSTLAAIHAVNTPTVTWARVATAVACCTAATFCFGTGFAAFAAMAALLVLRRSRCGQLLAMVGAAALVLLVYQVLLPCGAGVSASTDVWSLASWRDLPRWLAAPWIQAFFGLAIDGFQAGIATAVSLQPPHGSLLCAAARGIAAPLGPDLTMHLAGLALGLLGLALLAAASLRTWRQRPEPMPLQRLGLGLAVFACACGALVCATRGSYFGQFPDQVFAERYLPWSGLFWSGLFLYWGVGAPRRAVPAALAVVVLAVAIWPVHRAWLSWGASFRNLGERGALMLQHGIDDPDHGNLPADLAPFTLAECAEAHRAAGVAMFGEQTIPVIGSRLPPVAAPAADLPFIGMQRRIAPAGRVWLHAAQGLPEILLGHRERQWPIVDADGLVVGCARADEERAWLRRLPQPLVSRRGNFYVLEDDFARDAWLVEPDPPHRALAVIARALAQ